MNSSAKLAVALVLGAAVGGVAVHQLHAQAKPPAFLVFETEIKDRDAYEPHRQTSQRELLKAGCEVPDLGRNPGRA